MLTNVLEDIPTAPGERGGAESGADLKDGVVRPPNRRDRFQPPAKRAAATAAAAAAAAAVDEVGKLAAGPTAFVSNRRASKPTQTAPWVRSERPRQMQKPPQALLQAEQWQSVVVQNGHSIRSKRGWGANLRRERAEERGVVLLALKKAAAVFRVSDQTVALKREHARQRSQVCPSLRGHGGTLAARSAADAANIDCSPLERPESPRISHGLT